MAIKAVVFVLVW